MDIQTGADASGGKGTSQLLPFPAGRRKTHAPKVPSTPSHTWWAGVVTLVCVAAGGAAALWWSAQTGAAVRDTPAFLVAGEFAVEREGLQP